MNLKVFVTVNGKIVYLNQTNYGNIQFEGINYIYL